MLTINLIVVFNAKQRVLDLDIATLNSSSLPFILYIYYIYIKYISAGGQTHPSSTRPSFVAAASKAFGFISSE